MTILPAALSDWSEQLGILDPALAASFGSWLPILQRLVGPMPNEQRGLEGDPDGYSELSRRGSYERLVLSEWGVLDVAPDEFLRRASSSEHLFHSIARVQRTGGRRCVVLFDTGPLQLGAPRLAHLALLFVLSARARAASIRFVWGILQSPELGLQEALDRQGIQSFLGFRSAAALIPSHVDAWRSCLVSHRESRVAQTRAPVEADELWVVAERASIFGELPESRLVTVVDGDPGESRIVVTTTVSTERRRVALDLPRPDLAVRILAGPIQEQGGRGPFAPAIASGANLVFCLTGNRVLARLRNGHILAVDLPGPSGAKTVRCRTLPIPANHEVIAAGSRSGSLYAVAVHGDQYVLHAVKKKGAAFSQVLGIANSNDRPQASPVWLSPLGVGGSGNRLWFGDYRWRIYQVTWSSNRIEPIGPTHDRVLGWAAQGSQLISVRRTDEEITIVQESSPTTRPILFRTTAVGRSSEAFLFSRGDVRQTALALGDGGGSWRLRGAGSSNAFEPCVLPAGSQAFGLVTVAAAPWLVACGENRAELMLVGAFERKRICTFTGEVQHAAVHPNGQTIAASVDGQLWIVDREGRILVGPDTVFG